MEDCKEGCKEGCKVGCKDGCNGGCKGGCNEGCEEGCKEGCKEYCKEASNKGRKVESLARSRVMMKTFNQKKDVLSQNLDGVKWKKDKVHG